MASEGVSEIVLPDGTIMRFSRTVVILDQDDVGYIAVDTIAGGSIDICYLGDCAIYDPQHGWLFDDYPTCYRLGKIRSYLKRALNTPNPDATRLVRKAFAELTKMVEYCKGRPYLRKT